MAFPSTFLDIQNAVIAKARLDSTNDLAKVKDWINQVYAQVCVESEFVRGSNTSALTPSQANVTLPAGVIRLTSVQCKPSGGQYAPIRQVSLERLLALRGINSNQSTPTHYTVTQGSIELFPAAQGSETLQFWYSTLPTALSANTDVPVIDEPYASKLLEYGALVEAYDYMKDTIGGYVIRQVYQQWLQTFHDHLARREGVGEQADAFRDANPPPPSLHTEEESPV